MNVKCKECGKVFDLLDENQAEEYHYGHDCEEAGYQVDAIETEEEDLEFLDSLCEDGLMP